MSSVLTFIVPIRHFSNAADWNMLKLRLEDTVRSIAAQDSSRWNAVIVANRGSDLPVLPNGFDVAWVDFPPNVLHDQGRADKELFYDAFRADKGRRVLAGMLHAKPSGHIMIVDDDDFVSRRLTSFVEANIYQSGWYIDHGYMWEEGGRLLYSLSDFQHLCGTSHIIRADLYEVPTSFDEAEQIYIRRWLGSHVFIEDYLKAKGNELHPLPFPGAVYRIGHAGAHSKSKGIIRGQIVNRGVITNPLRLAKRISRLNWAGKRFRKEFFGDGNS